MPDLLDRSGEFTAEDKRLLNLAKANLRRRERRDIKRKLSTRELYLDDVLEAATPRACLCTAPLAEIVAAGRGFSRQKADLAIRECGLDPFVRLIAVPQWKRRELLRHLARKHGRALYGSAAFREYVC